MIKTILMKICEYTPVLSTVVGLGGLYFKFRNNRTPQDILNNTFIKTTDKMSKKMLGCLLVPGLGTVAKILDFVLSKANFITDWGNRERVLKQVVRNPSLIDKAHLEIKRDPLFYTAWITRLLEVPTRPGREFHPVLDKVPNDLRAIVYPDLYHALNGGDAHLFHRRVPANLHDTQEYREYCISKFGMAIGGARTEEQIRRDLTYTHNLIGNPVYARIQVHLKGFFRDKLQSLHDRLGGDLDALHQRVPATLYDAQAYRKYCISKFGMAIGGAGTAEQITSDLTYTHNLIGNPEYAAIRVHLKEFFRDKLQSLHDMAGGDLHALHQLVPATLHDAPMYREYCISNFGRAIGGVGTEEQITSDLNYAYGLLHNPEYAAIQDDLKEFFALKIEALQNEIGNQTLIRCYNSWPQALIILHVLDILDVSASTSDELSRRVIQVLQELGLQGVRVETHSLQRVIRLKFPSTIPTLLVW